MMASVQQTIVDELRRAGMSDAAIRGILANVKDESNFNPTLRHPDQPKFSGEAHYAHGLYQEGGTEWNNYASWLAKNGHGENWQDPALQTRFLAERLKSGYPSTWEKLNSGSPETAAQVFVSEYLRPREDYRRERSAKYAQGVPDIAGFGATSQTDKIDPNELAWERANSPAPTQAAPVQPATQTASTTQPATEAGMLGILSGLLSSGVTAAGFPETGGMLSGLFSQGTEKQKANMDKFMAGLDSMTDQAPAQAPSLAPQTEQANRQALASMMQQSQQRPDFSRLAQIASNRMRLGV